MNLADLKKRTITLLQCIDASFFNNTIQNIQQIEATNQSGFADLYAKALILYSVTTALTDEQLNGVTDRRIKLLLKAIFYDEILAEKNGKKLLSNTIDPQNFSDVVNLAGLYKRYRKVLKDFFNQAEALRSIYEARATNSCLRQIPENSPSFAKMQVDVDMDDEEEIVFLEDEITIGTTSLASCFAVVVLGKNPQNKTVASLGHFSCLTSNLITELKSNLVSNHEVQEPLQVYLVGGCISSLLMGLKFIKNTDLGITDFRIVINAAENDADEAAVLLGTESIYFTQHDTIKPKPILERKSEYFNMFRDETFYQWQARKYANEIQDNEESSDMVLIGKK
jgi:hypothetical protein